MTEEASAVSTAAHSNYVRRPVPADACQTRNSIRPGRYMLLQVGWRWPVPIRI